MKANGGEKEEVEIIRRGLGTARTRKLNKTTHIKTILLVRKLGFFISTADIHKSQNIRFLSGIVLGRV